MNKRIVFSGIMNLSVILFAFAGMFITNGLMERKEAQLLAEKGSIEMESPNMSLYNDKNLENENYETVLTPEQIADTLNQWKNPSNETRPHEPIEGQLPMEQAINKGEIWIRSMKEAGEFTAQDSSVFHEVTAALEIHVKQEESILELEPYYSYWRVQFTNEQLRICLYMNAVTGQVWEADIVIYDVSKVHMEGDDSASLTEFAKLAGIDNKKIVNKVDGEKDTALYFENCNFYVEKKYDSNKISEYGGNSYGYIMKVKE